jgi:phosphoglycolate phosphatase
MQVKRRSAQPDLVSNGGPLLAIRGILFDKDGTIVDYWRTWVPINRKVALFAARGDQALSEELLRLGGHDPATDRVLPGSPLAAGDFDDIANAFAAHPDVAAASELAPEIERIFCAGGAAHSALIEGARETIIELKRRAFRIGLATNDSAGGLEASLAQHDILHLFEFTAGCDSGYGSKPDPRMVLAFCACVGIERGQVAVVGDAVHDLAMGRAARAGLTVGVLSGTSARRDLENYADAIVADVNALLAMPEFSTPG